MSERYNVLVALIKRWLPTINAATDGIPAKDAFQIVLNKLPVQERDNMLNGLEAMTKNPDDVIKNKGVIPQVMLSVSPELREIQRTINELVPC